MSPMVTSGCSTAETGDPLYGTGTPEGAGDRTRSPEHKGAESTHPTSRRARRRVRVGLGPNRNGVPVRREASQPHDQSQPIIRASVHRRAFRPGIGQVRCCTLLLYKIEKAIPKTPEMACDLGGAEGIRTPDPLDANEVRYQAALQPLNRRQR